MADINISQGQSVPQDMHTKYEDMGDGTHALVVSVGGTIPVSGGLTDAQIRATPLPVSGPATNAELRLTSLDVDVMTYAVPVGAPIVGQAVIAVTGTAVVLGTTVTLPAGTVLVTALSTNNAAHAVVGATGVANTKDGTGDGYILEAGKSVVINADDLADVFVNGTAGDIFSYAAG